jgi:hypothetical protein
VDSAVDKPPQKISAAESGYLFVRSEIFPNRPGMSDMSGIRKVYVFIPERYILAAKSSSTTITRSDGLRAFEYSKNDASPEDYCFQELPEGEVTAQVLDGKLAIAGRLKTQPITEPTDARCDSSEFSGPVIFPI